MGPGSGWSITESNNCLLENGLLTIKSKQEPKTYFADGYNTEDTSFFVSSGKYTFNVGSYLEIDNINSIIPDYNGGWAVKFDSSITAPTSGKKTLMVFGSKKSKNYIEFYIDSNSDLKVSSNTDSTKTLITDLPSSDFYIGYYKNIEGTSKIFYLPSTGTAQTQTIILSEIPSAYLRIGSDNLWFELDNINDYDDAKVVSDSNLLKIVGIHKDNISLLDSFSEIEGTDFIHYYTATPNKQERRFKIKSYGYAKIDIDKQSLCKPLYNNTGACRIEIGSPVGSETIKMSLSDKLYSNNTEASSTTIYTKDYLNRIITSGSWLNNKSVQQENSATNPSDTLSFEFYLTTDDLINMPPYINYFRVFSYNLEQDGDNYYVNNNSSQAGNSAKIYLKSNECNIPDLIEMPFFYNGFSSGLRLKNSYTKINYNFNSINKYSAITNISVSGGNATYTLSNNTFIAGDVVSVSEINGTNQFAFVSKEVSSVSGNNVIFNDFAPTGTYTVDNGTVDGTAGVMQTASGISTVSFMCYIPSGTDVSNNIIKIGSKQLSINSSTGAMSTITGATRYVNGSSSTTAKIDEWQMISLVFSSPIVVNYENPVEIILGSENGIDNEIFIDQLMIFDKNISGDLLINLYNLFVGDTKNEYKITATSKIKLTDTSNNNLDSETTIDINYKPTTGAVYDLLKNGTTPVNMNVVYAVSSGKPTIEKKTVNQSSAANTLTLSNSQYLVNGASLLSVNGVAITTPTTISSINTSNPAYSVVTLSRNIGITNNNIDVIFSDKVFEDNATNNAKIKVGTKYLEQGDILLIENGSNKYIYTITTLPSAASFLYNITANTYQVTFTKITGEPVNGINYLYSYGTSYYDLTNSLATALDKNKLSFSSRINSKIQPQYLPTE